MHTIQSIKLIDTCTQSSTVQFNCDLGVTRKTEHVEWRWNGDALDLVSVLHIVPSLHSVQTFSQLDSVQMFSAMDRRKISFAEFSAQLLFTKFSRPRSSASNYSFNEHFIYIYSYRLSVYWQQSWTKQLQWELAAPPLFTQSSDKKSIFCTFTI